jgi:uncharacterized membrane protein YdfJ with MMPL/SSD domain
MMDDPTRLLTEIRDLLQRHLELSGLERERAKRADDERKAAMDESLRLYRRSTRFVRRWLVFGAVAIAVLLYLLYCILPRTT